MGMWFSSLLSYFGEKEARILVLGLDNAGKTTILCKLTKNAEPSIIPRVCLARFPMMCGLRTGPEFFPHFYVLMLTLHRVDNRPVASWRGGVHNSK
jgi:GTPase SAR1 family protein